MIDIQSTAFNVYLNASKSKISAVLTWVNDGNYTLSNGSISSDWDLELVRPNGSIISSTNHTDPWEVLNFTITQSGIYKFRMIRFAFQNPTVFSELGLSVNWDDSMWRLS